MKAIPECLRPALAAAVLLATGASVPAAAAVPPERPRTVLGPGDILDLELYGRGDLTQSSVFVRPDGTIGFLQATSVRAQGRTVDELRAALEAELAEHHRSPRVVITPVELRSRRYVILGKVVDQGVYALDRPLTLVEAVARARGIETGLFESNTVEIADLPRSFLARGGERLDIDFQKLFLGGDLSQNVALEPGDFIFLASAISNDVHVLGEVAQPGVLGFSANLTVVGAITVRGGFTGAAFRSRVLVVRGSFGNPETIVVDVGEILAGRAPDVRLQPKDLLFVSARPWREAEELVDIAIGTFLRSMTATWATENVGAIVPEGGLPQR